MLQATTFEPNIQFIVCSNMLLLAVAGRESNTRSLVMNLIAYGGGQVRPNQAYSCTKSDEQAHFVDVWVKHERLREDAIFVRACAA